MSSHSSPSGYTTREVARLLGLAEGQILSFVRAGFLHPRRGAGGAYVFGFQDLVVLKAAAALMAGDIPAAKVRRSLAKLMAELPRGRSLAGLRLTAEGRRIVVRDGHDAWEPDSGQRLLDFSTAELAERAGPVIHRHFAVAREQSQALGAEGRFEMGLELEAGGGSAEESMEAYRRVLALAPEHGDAHLNLGRLHHESGEVEAAEVHYRCALDSTSSPATAAFNLGVALQDQGRAKEAVAAYRQAIAADPGYAHAHYNLSGLLEELGERGEALRSLKTYRNLMGEPT